MVRFPRPLLITFFLLLLIAVDSTLVQAHQILIPRQKQTEKKPQEEPETKDKRARKAERKKQAEVNKEAEKTETNNAADAEESVEIVSDKQSKNGDLFLYEGYVNATQGEMRLQADRVTFNSTSDDMIAEGNVIFDQGADQRVTAHRAEINWRTKRGIFWDSTGFTNRTQTGDYVFFTAQRVEKTGPDTYELFEADVTACEDVIPKWSFKARHAELKMGDRVTMRNAVFRVKTLPAFVLPYVWIPATRRERKSGFLLPSTGNSNQKGRTLKMAYYQTLGQSADITFRGDIYTQRGLGLGAEFRAQTDDNSFLRLSVFSVKDRLFGPPGEKQGGTAFFGEGVQHLGHGWLAVGNVSLVTSLAFRQVFSDDIAQVIDPRRESTFYANNNTNGFSFNFLATNETTTLFSPSQNPETPSAGTNFDVKIRHAPVMNLSLYPRRFFDNLPIYFSFDSSIGALKKEETVDTNVILVTPAAVQRFDFQPKITVPLATIGGFAITPSLTVRETYYTSSMDPDVPAFNPDTITFDPSDRRLDPKRIEFAPAITLFDRSQFDPIIPIDISRNYAELAVDVRPPALERTFTNQDGSARLKHLIEPYITYRLIRGVGEEFNKIIRFDDGDAVANTNEVEYAIVNRFFTRRSSADLLRKRSKKGRSSDTATVQANDNRTPASDSQAHVKLETTAKPQPPAAEQTDQLKSEKPQTEKQKSKLETGKPDELRTAEEQATASRRDRQQPVTDDNDASNEDESPQAYEFLAVKIAQKYFFDRTFGGALVEGRRNQFYPISTLSGFTFGGRARSLSPLNVAIRYRPLSSIYGDLRMDLDAESGVRNITLGAGVRSDKVSVAARYYLSRRLRLDANNFEPGTFPGDQISTTVQLGDDLRGWYGGSRIGYDFTNRFISDTDISRGRLMNSRSYFGYSWDCCGLQFNYNTFKAGLRSEGAWSVTFNLAGLGSYGTDQFSQLGGGGRGARKRGKKSARYDDYLQ